MRKSLSILLAFAIHTVFAQCSCYPLGNFGQPNNFLSVRVPDGVIAVGDPNDVFGDFVVFKTDFQGNTLWSKRHATTNTSVLMEVNTVIDSYSGGVVISGTRNVAGHINFFVIELDADGNEVWARIFQSWNPGYDTPPRVAKGSNGGYVLVYDRNTYASMMVVDLNSMGVPQWTTRLDFGPNINFQSVAGVLVDSNGDIVILVQVGYGAQVMLLKLNSVGAHIWSSERHDIVGHIFVNELYESSTGDYLIGGVGGGSSSPFGSILASFSSSDGSMNSLNMLGPSSIWASTSAIVDILERASGDLVILKKDGSGLYTSSSGVLLNSWDKEASKHIQRLIALPGDSIGFFGEEHVSGTTRTFLAITDGNDIACVTDAGTVSAPSLPPTVTSFATTVTAVVDSIKTWTKSLLDPSPNVVDVTVHSSTGPFRPGFNAQVALSAINQGALTSGPISATLDFDPILSVSSTSTSPSSSSPGQLMWSGAALAHWQSAQFTVVFTLPPDTALLGDTLYFSWDVQQDSVDNNVSNNHQDFQVVVVGSYDPNDKLVSPEGLFDVQNDSVLHYTIRFQNTGTDTAFQVAVIDTLPAEVSVGTFVPGAASHPYTYELGGDGVLKFQFDNILLPDSNVNEPLSHGLVSFTVRPDNGLAIGTMISNEADIYFDFNPPVRTPPAIVAYGLVTGLPAILEPNELSVYPVPVHDFLTIVKPADFASKQLLIHSFDGRLIQVGPADYFNEQAILPMSGLSSGQYVLTLVDKAGKRLYARFVKE